jgi:hypothetical protein
MFSLIITIVSIALVVALVAATMYHGGDTLTQGRASAQASAYVTGAEQIAGAYQMNQALNGPEILKARDLVTAKMLSSVPALFTEADWNGAIWLKGADDAPFSRVMSPTENLTIEVCQALDKMAGRAPVEREDLPNPWEFDKLQPYGCTRGEGLSFYFKM